MKKIICLLLVTVLAISLCACGKKTGTTTVVTDGDARIVANTTKNDDGTLALELSADAFDSMGGAIVGIQFTVAFSDATYSESKTAEYPDGWSINITNPETANSNHEVIGIMLDDNLKTCFPNQSIGTFTFKDIKDTTKIDIKDIKLVFYMDNKTQNPDAIRAFFQDDFTAYPNAQ